VRSGFPSTACGAAAVRFALPSAVRGIPGVGWFTHCAATEIVIVISVIAVSRSFIPLRLQCDVAA
jgi:hypothetical protein